MRVFVLEIRYPSDDSDFSAYTTEDDAFNALETFVRDHWNDHPGELIEDSAPKNQLDAIDAYFTGIDYEQSYTIHELEVQD